MQGIYCIHCLANDKRYVGKSTNLDNRIVKHKLEFRKGRQKKDIQEDYDKYGVDNFKYIILEITNVLNKCEEYWTLFYKSHLPEFGYNYLIGNHQHGDKNGFFKKHHTEEARKKIGAASKGNQYNKGRSPWNKGKHHTEKQIEALKAAWVRRKARMVKEG